MIEYQCVGCGITLESPPEKAGQLDLCPDCGAANPVPGDDMGAVALRVKCRRVFESYRGILTIGSKEVYLMIERGHSGMLYAGMIFMAFIVSAVLYAAVNIHMALVCLAAMLVAMRFLPKRMVRDRLDTSSTNLRVTPKGITVNGMSIRPRESSNLNCLHERIEKLRIQSKHQGTTP